METPASRTSASCNPEAEASSWRSMALSPGSLLRRWRRAPQLPDVYGYNPSDSDGVGILSAVMDPATAGARLRVVGPLIHSGARDILEVALPSLCGSHRRPFRATLLSCGRCSYWIGRGAVYMYKGEIGFCKRECRDDYITEELLRRDSRQKRGREEKVPTMVDGERSSIFFTCADIL